MTNDEIWQLPRHPGWLQYTQGLRAWFNGSIVYIDEIYYEGTAGCAVYGRRVRDITSDIHLALLLLEGPEATAQFVMARPEGEEEGEESDY